MSKTAECYVVMDGNDPQEVFLNEEKALENSKLYEDGYIIYLPFHP